MEKDQQFAGDIIKGIVRHPEEVVVDRKVDDMGVLLTVHVNREDMGIVIGKAGMNANAIRVILKAFGTTVGERINLKFEEPEGGKFHNRPRFSRSTDEILGREPAYAGHEEGSGVSQS